MRLNDTDEIVQEVMKDFNSRQQGKRAYEAQWQLNTNFWLGNQYCIIDRNSNVIEEEETYFWQNRLVFNHFAQILEMRLVKLNRVRPKISVRPFSSDTKDTRAAKMSTKILNSIFDKLNLNSILNEATLWSELTGTSFYKITWDSNGGKLLGEKKGHKIYEGEIKIDVCSPYEIYPDSLSCQNIDCCKSIIHARALHVDEIEQIWKIKVDPQNVDLIIMDNSWQRNKQFKGNEGKYAVVVERYTRPTVNKPNGELVIVASNKLLYYGELPYINGFDGKRTLPFVKQDSIVNVGSFFGTSILERLIPIQRAFNAVKNRKHEFLNRISMGVLAIEDGSVDTDDLMQEGLPPGKILTYRIGSKAPHLLDSGSVPTDFSREEQTLLQEFSSLSGVSEIMRNSTLPDVSSGTAIQLLVEQDDTRLALTAENIRSSVRIIGQHILRLYKQFATEYRLSRIAGDDGDIEIIGWNESDLSSDDVVLDTVNELSMTPANQQNMLFQLLKYGLLNDSEGKISETMKYKILDVMGYGGWEQTVDLATLHVKRAETENISAENKKLEIEDIDDHELHIDVHTKFVLSECLNNKKLKEKILEHIREHKQAIKLINTEITSKGENNAQ